jgi:DNA repair protein RecO (recombination protein O)
VVIGESDLIVTLFTESHGRISALARGARKSQRRFGGGFEPFHTLRLRLEEREGRDLWTLAETSLDVARHGLVSSLVKMEAGGRALSWLRRGTSERTSEPEIWRSVIALLDAFDDGGVEDLAVKRRLAEFGLALLSSYGWGLELEQCIACGRTCEPNQSSLVDAARGGLVCRGCGGGPLRLRGAERERLARATRGEVETLDGKDAEMALQLVEAAMRAHVGPE